MAAKSKNADMTRGNILRLIVSFAIPLLIGNLFQQLYNMVDSMVVGQFESYQALSAVGTSGTPLQVLISMFLGIGIGATILVSQAIGSGDSEKVKRIVSTATTFSVLIALPVTLIGMVFTDQLLSLIKVPADVFAMAHDYFFIVMLGTIANIGYNLNSGILRGMGDSRSPLYFLILSTCINIVLDLLFVAVFHWGVAGVAIATVIAQFSAWIYSIFYIRHHHPQLELNIFRLKADKPILKDMMRLGLPIGFNNSIFSLGHLLIQSLINVQGSAFMAACTASSRIDNIIFLPIASFGAAATTFSGQNVGARDEARLKEGVKTIFGVSLTVNIIMSILVLVFGRQLLLMFNSDPAVLDAGMNCIWWIVPYYWIFAVFNLCNNYMNGAGEVRLPTMSSLIMFWVVRLPVAYWLTATFGMEYMYACYPISWIVGALISGIYYKSGRWKRHYQ